MKACLPLVAALLWICSACKDAPQQIGPQKVGADAALASDAGERPKASAVQPPTAAEPRRAEQDAGRSLPPKVERRDAAAVTTKDSGAEPHEPVCVPARDLPDKDGELEIAGLRRLFSMHVPANLPTARAAPLLIDVHGLMKHARYQRANSGFATEADRAGFVVVYPQALDNAWNLGVADCCGADPVHDDVEFIRALVAKLQQSACIDPKRICSLAPMSAAAWLSSWPAVRAICSRRWSRATST